MDRKRYDLEFKLKLVKEALETGNSAAVARRHDLHASVVSRWVRQYQTHGETGFGNGKAETSDTAHLYDPKEFRKLEDENDTLKKLLGEKDLEINVLRDLLKKGNRR